MGRVIAALVCTGCIVVATPGAAVPEPLETLAALSVAPGPLMSQVTVSDEVTIMLVGTALIGLAALLRRAC
jgi:hypothetical protein